MTKSGTKKPRIVLSKSKKDIHLVVDRTDWIGMRILAFEHELSMQDVYRGFAKMCLNRHSAAVAIFQRISKEKKNAEITKYLNPTGKEDLSTLDALYDYMESENSEDESGEGEND